MRRFIFLISLPLALAACKDDGTVTDDSAIGDDSGVVIDEDGDGYAADGDCDDNDASVNPGATEVPYDGVDNDCDESTVDDDLDGDGYAQADDCDDEDPAVNPGATEACNEIDDDCDGEVDNAVGDTWYADVDGDGYGDPTTGQVSCENAQGYVADNTDCDDTRDDVYPEAEEVCDEVDNDCDGTADEDVTLTFYQDVDGDSFGVDDATTQACAAPTGYAEVSGDCDDAEPAVNPAATEVCNEIDDDCDGVTDEDDAADAGTWYADSDGDTYGDAATSTVSCDQPTGYVADDDDCDDTDASLNPDTVWYVDYDADGYGATRITAQSCTQPSGFVANSDDCEDTDAAISPSAQEICDDIDNDCDGLTDDDDSSVDPSNGDTFYADADADGYGDASSTTLSCDTPSGYVSDDTDCDDTDSATNPGAAEACDGVDNDCDGVADSGLLGSDTLCAAESCLEILNDGSSTGDGDYYLDPLNTGTATLYTCDMTTDGGGWTLMADWDRQNDGEDETDFAAAYDVTFQGMGVWTTSSSALRWYDDDLSSDVLAVEKTLDVPNNGEVLVDLKYTGNSMECSGTFFYIEDAAGVDTNVICDEDTACHASSHGSDDYTAAELAYLPNYTCPLNTAGTWTWNSVYQVAGTDELTTFHLRSFHWDSNGGDNSNLYWLDVWVR
ncbi:MAG: hypothetical protein H6739_27910 [Alphaproteobacteria bacterium]|nr:hypothetical protein [Alphaproteobacteria bacterium]